MSPAEIGAATARASDSTLHRINLAVDVAAGYWPSRLDEDQRQSPHASSVKSRLSPPRPTLAFARFREFAGRASRGVVGEITKRVRAGLSPAL